MPVIAAALLILAQGMAPPVRAEQVPLIGNEGPDLDACIGIGRVSTLEPDLAVREQPGDYARQKDRLPHSTLVWLCEKGGGENGEDWQGIVYPSGEYQDLGDCRVSSPVPEPRPYAGPCRFGWVIARDIRLVTS